MASVLEGGEPGDFQELELLYGRIQPEYCQWAPEEAPPNIPRDAVLNPATELLRAQLLEMNASIPLAGESESRSRAAARHRRLFGREPQNTFDLRPGGNGGEQYNDCEAAIIQALRERGPLKGEDLAAAAGYEYNSNFKGTLSSLRKRSAIKNERNTGYFLP